MGFLQDLGIDELVPAIADLVNEVQGIKDDLIGGLQDGIIQPIQEQATDFKGAIQESAENLNGPNA